MPRTRRSYIPEDLSISDEEDDMNELSFYDGPPWEPPDIICEQLNESGIVANNQPLQKWAVENVVKLLEDECTVPFIARYRKEQTDNMEAPVIREIKSSLEELKAVQDKTKSHLEKLAKEKKLTRELRESLCNSHSMLELEQLFAPFKSGSKTTLAERARKAGLEPAAELLMGKDAATFNAQNFIKFDTKGCGTAGEVEKGVQHIIADTVAKDKTTMDQLRSLYKELKHQVYVHTTKTNQTRKKTKKEKFADPDKFQLYFDKKLYVSNIKPHQVLAINRGEDLGVLSVKVVLPATLPGQFFHWCKVKWSSHTPANSYASRIISISVEDAYNRLMSPMLIREIRSTLNKSAEKASVDVFGQNLHRLLLTPPVKGRVILGVDPGFKNGCKLALISPTGDVLHTDVSYIHTANKYREKDKIINIIKDFGCSTVGIGNGTACRQTEEFFSQLISSGALAPLPVMYCIVNEDGASIYSVSPEADKEMPNLDPNLRSAVSIARRLQDPLAELVKIEPKHIGVGMYQHDIPERRLKLALEDVVEECVSFVGVDLNVCSEVLLRCVSGITASLAKKIITHRKNIGTFINREQLLDIKGVGPKTFKQCAGFVRINPSVTDRAPASDEVIVISDSESTEEDVKPLSRKRGASRTAAGQAKRKKTSKSSAPRRPDPLDATWVHPESYDKTRELLKMASARVTEIGTPDIRCKLDKIVQSQGKGSLARCIDVGEPTLQLIIDGLKQPKNYDIRVEFEKPLFKQGVLSVEHVTSGMRLTGRVINAVHFGVFVDIGVGQSCLCHNKHMPWSVLRGRTLGPGDKIDVVVMDKKTRSNGKTDIGVGLVAVH